MRLQFSKDGAPAKQFSKQGYSRYTLLPGDGSYLPAQAFFFTFPSETRFSLIEPETGLLHLMRGVLKITNPNISLGQEENYTVENDSMSALCETPSIFLYCTSTGRGKGPRIEFQGTAPGQSNPFHVLFDDPSSRLEQLTITDCQKGLSTREMVSESPGFFALARGGASIMLGGCYRRMGIGTSYPLLNAEKFSVMAEAGSILIGGRTRHYPTQPYYPI